MSNTKHVEGKVYGLQDEINPLSPREIFGCILFFVIVFVLCFVFLIIPLWNKYDTNEVALDYSNRQYSSLMAGYPPRA